MLNTNYLAFTVKKIGELAFLLIVGVPFAVTFFYLVALGGFVALLNFEMLFSEQTWSFWFKSVLVVDSLIIVIWPFNVYEELKNKNVSKK